MTIIVLLKIPGNFGRKMDSIEVAGKPSRGSDDKKSSNFLIFSAENAFCRGDSCGINLTSMPSGYAAFPSVQRPRDKKDIILRGPENVGIRA